MNSAPVTTAARKVLGIDPGLYGAIALLTPATGELSIWDVPIFNVGKGKARKMVVDESQMANIIDNIADEVSEAWLEQVGSRPGEGHVGAFNFGRTYGFLRGVLAANFLRVNDVTPAVWKGALRVTGDKDQSRHRASQIMPSQAFQWPLKKHDGRAEATLIAHYGATRTSN